MGGGKNNPFKKNQGAGSQGPASANVQQPQDAGQVSSEALAGQVVGPDPAVSAEASEVVVASLPEQPVVPEVPEVPEAPVVPEVAPAAPPLAPVVPEAAKPEPVVDKSKFSKEEAKAYIKEQFAAKIPVEVIALQDGEHPRPGQWKKEGQKFKLQNAEAYSHRWMKLA